ncbi:MAG: DNA-3-methyladenine glycosylase [Bacteroidota bacterium]
MQKIRRHLSQDPILKKVIQSIELPPLPKSEDVYFDLLRSIAGQQLSVKAAQTIFGRFLELFPKSYPDQKRLIRMEEEQLRGVGLSRAKAAYVRNVALFFQEEKVDKKQLDAMSNEEIIRYLTQIKGVGRWTVEMILMFSMDRPDVLPLSDLGIRNGIVELYQLEETGKALHARLEEIAEPWRPYRTTACRYVWRWKDGGGL